MSLYLGSKHMNRNRICLLEFLDPAGGDNKRLLNAGSCLSIDTSQYPIRIRRFLCSCIRILNFLFT